MYVGKAATPRAVRSFRDWTNGESQYVQLLQPVESCFYEIDIDSVLLVNDVVTVQMVRPDLVKCACTICQQSV